MPPVETTRPRALSEIDQRPPAKRCRRNSTATVLPRCIYCSRTSTSTVTTNDEDESTNQLDLTSVSASLSDNGVLEHEKETVLHSDFLVTSLRAISCPLPIATPELPDEVLVTVLRFVQNAGILWRLRAVSRRWRRVIDAHETIWRDASFKGVCLTRPVIIRPKNKLCLGPRRGRSTIQHAASCGNEWAIFLQSTLLNNRQLQAVTVAQPTASALVFGARSFETREAPPRGWVVVHAARRGPVDLPRGALLGMVRVVGGRQIEGAWRWSIDRNIGLVKPLRCAGYVGLWPLSAHLTELLIRGVHFQ